MKTGCCVSLFGEEILSLPQTGADYAEIGLSALQDRPLSQIRERAAELKEAGVSCLAANSFFPASLRLTGEGADHAAVAPYLENVLEKAAVLGIRTVVFGSGGARAVPGGFPRERAWEQLYALCKERLVPAFAARDMVCCIEPLRRQESNILNTCAESARLVREVDDPHLRLLVDLYHFDWEQEPRASLADYEGILAHAHIASAKNARALPRPGDGEDYAGFFRQLQKIGYPGAVSLEGTITGEFVPCVRTAVETLRQVQASL